MVGMMRVDYRYLRFVSVPFYVFALVLLVLVFVPSLNVVVGGSARWLKIGPLPALHPAEFAKLALIIYLAHWFAKRGTPVQRLLRPGPIPFLIIVAPDRCAGLQGARPRDDDGHRPDRVDDVLRRRRRACVHFALIGCAALVAIVVVGLRGYQMDRIRAWLDPWSDPLGRRASTRSRDCSPSGSAASSAPGSARAGWPAASSCRTPATTTSSRSSARSSGSSAAAVVIVLFVGLAYAGHPRSRSRPGHVRRAAGGRASPPGCCIQAFINIGVVVALIPVTGITLPFISAGGSSLTISFAAVGILLSISRETVDTRDVERCGC